MPCTSVTSPICRFSCDSIRVATSFITSITGGLANGRYACPSAGFAACLSVLAFCLTLAAPTTLAQTATVSGFVTDASDGQPLEGATIALRDASDGPEAAPRYGAAANDDGLFLIRVAEAGRYALTISFIGYESYRDTLVLGEGEAINRNVALLRSEEMLDDVVVQAERQQGMTPVTAGHQRIRPAEIELVPSPDISGDLANYLTTLPGVVTTADRGGQFFVRGGEPSQNLVLLDGIVLYQPFHVVGSYSAFPTDIISTVDVFAGGFGPEHAGRLSSVIDVSARDGNTRRFAGHASVSPFAASTLVEGPIIPARVSFIGSARQSLIERSGESIYQKDLPFEFRDAFGKLHIVPNGRSRLSISGISTFDRGTLVPEIEGGEDQQIQWRNEGFGVRWLVLPRLLDISLGVRVTHSRHEMHQGTPADTARSTYVSSTRIALNASWFHPRTTSELGWDAVFTSLHNTLGGLFQNVEDSEDRLRAVGFFYNPELLLGRMRLKLGMRVQWYEVGFDPYLEPRIQVRWNRGVHQVSAAAGLYHQEVAGLYDRRDAASVFTAWTNVPRVIRDFEGELGTRLPQAVHGLVGYRTSPATWLSVSVDGFYKQLSELFVAEWTAYPRFTTRMQPAHGRSIGFDARVELRRGAFYGYVNYGFSSTIYAAEQASLQLWYGEESLRFRPPHDRRHQVNALASASIAGFDVSARWSFGSGLPFSRAVGFDGFIPLVDFVNVLEEPGTSRVIYERPYNDVLPTYHRLDVSVERTFSTRAADVALFGSVMNLYDRRNLFYVDVFTLRRADQLPIVPSFGIKVGLP